MGKWKFKTVTAEKGSVMERRAKNKRLDRMKKEIGEGRMRT